MAITVPEDFRPSPFFDEDHGGFVNQMQGFITFAAMAMIGTFGFARAGVVSSGPGIRINNTMYYKITYEQAAAVEAELITMDEAANLGLTIPRMSAEMSALITESATAGMSHGVGLFSAEALIALELENITSPSPRIPMYFNSIQDYINYHFNHLGEGSGGTGGTGGSPPTPPSGGGWTCYTWPDGSTNCFWTPN